MEKIISKDGTSLAYKRVGNGTPLVLVHGTNGSSSHWNLVQPLLAPYFTLYILDRRGRGKSGDNTHYNIESEANDIAVLANSIKEPVDVLGHSFGAGCVLSAAKYITNLHRLILYEPPMFKNQHSPQRSLIIEEMEKALKIGNREDVVILMLRDIMRLPTETVERIRSAPSWVKALPGAHTIPREIRQSDAYGADEEALKAILVPTLFLLGTDSPDYFRVTTELLHTLLPNSQIVMLEGQQHNAMFSAPQLFAKAVIEFLI